MLQNCQNQRVPDITVQKLAPVLTQALNYYLCHVSTVAYQSTFHIEKFILTTVDLYPYTLGNRPTTRPTTGSGQSPGCLFFST